MRKNILIMKGIVPGRERRRRREKSWFEAPQQTGQRDLLKRIASVQSIV